MQAQASRALKWCWSLQFPQVWNRDFAIARSDRFTSHIEDGATGESISSSHDTISCDQRELIGRDSRAVERM
jgi:hypothetical protein